MTPFPNECSFTTIAVEQKHYRTILIEPPLSVAEQTVAWSLFRVSREAFFTHQL